MSTMIAPACNHNTPHIVRQLIWPFFHPPIQPSESDFKVLYNVILYSICTQGIAAKLRYSGAFCHVNVNIQVYSPAISIGSADCRFTTLVLKHTLFNVSSPLWKIQHLCTILQFRTVITILLVCSTWYRKHCWVGICSKCKGWEVYLFYARPFVEIES